MSRLALNDSVMVILLMDCIIDGRGDTMHEECEVLPREASILRECLSQVSSAHNLIL
jgi:hypothetical protein